MGLVRILMFIMNFVLWAIGGVLLGIGIWLKVDPTALDSITFATDYGMSKSTWDAAVIIMIVVGALVFGVGFLGCLGAMQAKNKPKNFFLKLYFVSVKLIIILEIVTIILAAVFWGSLTDSVRNEMTSDVQTKYKGEPPAADPTSVTLNNMQMILSCCGGANYTDYVSSIFTQETNVSVPWTCCVLKVPGKVTASSADVKDLPGCRNEGSMPYNSTYKYTTLNARGCYEGLTAEIESNSGLIIGLCSGFIGLEILGYIFACLIMRGGD